jgi:hypothetical protein
MNLLAWPEVIAVLLVVSLLALIGLNARKARRRASSPAQERDEAPTLPPPVPSPPRRPDVWRRSRVEAAVRTCVLCRFQTELDDVAVGRGATGCICLGCFARATGSQRPMPAALRRAIIDALAEVHVP